MTVAPRVNPRGPFPDSLKGACVAIGNFDGVHLGHQALLAGATAWSDAPLAVLSFDPNPKHFFAPDSPPNRLMRHTTMDKKLAGFGVQSVFSVPFGISIAEMTDAEFVEDILVNRCGVRAVAIGSDFRFGKGRMGDAETLARLGEHHGFSVKVVSPISEQAAASNKISSTTIRNYLRQGLPTKAAELLGHYWAMDGAVVEGEKRGRTIGFPTANLDIGDLLHPKHGVYAIKARINRTGDWLDGVANFGRTPTTGLRAPLLEAHIFNFGDDIYGAWLEVALVSYLRPELKFDTLDAMVTRMHEDCVEAKQKLALPSVAMPQ